MAGKWLATSESRSRSLPLLPSASRPPLPAPTPRARRPLTVPPRDVHSFSSRSFASRSHKNNEMSAQFLVEKSSVHRRGLAGGVRRLNKRWVYTPTAIFTTDTGILLPTTTSDVAGEYIMFYGSVLPKCRVALPIITVVFLRLAILNIDLGDESYVVPSRDAFYCSNACVPAARVRGFELAVASWRLLSWIDRLKQDRIC